MGWLFLEDAAVKAKFAALSVSAPTGPQAVSVRFRLPQKELGALDFPTIIIDQAVISKADDREHRGRVNLSYIPEGIDPDTVLVYDENGNLVRWADLGPDQRDLTNLWADYPIPYNLDYTVTAYTRTNQELTELVGKLAQYDRIPHRFGYVYVPELDNSRYLDVIGGPNLESAFDKDGKRIFSAVYSIRVTSELILGAVTTTPKRVETVETTVDAVVTEIETF